MQARLSCRKVRCTFSCQGLAAAWWAQCPWKAAISSILGLSLSTYYNQAQPLAWGLTGDSSQTRLVNKADSM